MISKQYTKYYDFRKRDIEMTPHALGRFVGQKTGKGKKQFSEKEFIDIWNKKANYYEKGTNKEIKSYNGINIVYDKNNKEVVTIESNKKIKERWGKYGDA